MLMQMLAGLVEEETMTPALGRIVIHTGKIDHMAEFYARYFGFPVVRSMMDRIVELVPQTSGATILLHPAASKQRGSQVLVKLIFDVEVFCAVARANGLEFGKIH